MPHFGNPARYTFGRQKKLGECCDFEIRTSRMICVACSFLYIGFRIDIVRFILSETE